jgi:hypothetical protein
MLRLGEQWTDLRNHGVSINSPSGSLFHSSPSLRSCSVHFCSLYRTSPSTADHAPAMPIATLRRSPQHLSRPLNKRACSLPARRTLATVSPEHTKVVVGIRREDPSRIWERRCPVTPDEVAQLVQRLNVDVLIQNCDRRVFPVDHFIKVS